MIAIVGAGGGLGSLACQYAKAMGLRVIAIDAGDEKKEMTSKLGAEAFVDFASSQNVVKDVQAATPDGLGPHAVLLVAVNEKPFQQAAEVCSYKPVCFCSSDKIHSTSVLEALSSLSVFQRVHTSVHQYSKPSLA